MQIGLSLSLTAQLRLSISAYAVSGLDPSLVFDFKGNYFRKSATASTFGASITHAATTNATMVDSDGLLKWRPHNNLAKSNTFSTWTKNSTVAVDNAATGPNGVANTASTVNFSTGGSSLYNLSTVTVKAGDKVTLAAWVRSDTITSITFAINGRTSPGNNTLETNLAVTSTWALVSFEATVITNDTGLYFIIGKVNPSSPASQIGDFEIYGAHMFRSDLGGMVNNPDTASSYVPTTSAAVYSPRRGHHIYNGSAWVNEGILHESEARTNLIENSNDLTNVEWKKTSVSNTANAGVSPDGTSNANKVVNDTASGVHYTYVKEDLHLVSGDYTSSFYVASAGYGFVTVCAGTNTSDYYAVVIDLSDGTKTATYEAGTQTDKTCTVEDVGGSYYRVSISGDGSRYFIVGGVDTGTYTPADYGFKSFSGDGTSGILAYGAQIEAGSTPSSYIPTGSSTVTRAAETLTVPAANLPYDSTNMSIQMDGKMTYADTGGDNGKLIRWEKDVNNKLWASLDSSGASTGSPYWTQRSLGVSSFTSSLPQLSPDTNVPFNLSSRHGSTFLNGAVGGTAGIADTTPTSFPDLSASSLSLGHNFMGTIGQFRMWDEDLTDAGIVEAST